MVALVAGLIFIVFAVFAVLPVGLDWSADVLRFLRGAGPVLAAFVGLLCVFIGVADMRDKAEAKKEEAAEAAAASSEDKPTA